MTRLLSLIITVLVLAALIGVVVRASSKGENDSKDPQIKTLIDRLVSWNTPPIAQDANSEQTPLYRLPQSFDRKKQEQVWKVRNELKSIGTKAFPLLIDRWDDGCYCLTASDGLSGSYENKSLGEVCKMIIYDQIQPYGFWQNVDFVIKPPLRPSYTDTFLSTKEEARKWYEKHKDASIMEIQLEARDWVIAEEKKHVGKYPDAERDYLLKLRTEMAITKKPITHGNYYSLDFEE